ncbi:MAG: MBOAT family protein [Ruminiclostridium sp.]|nr:MBOAT family protein [Ruminiclostridium sp.]
MAACFIAYFVSRKTVYRNWVLIVFSLIFYAWGEPVWVFLLLGSVGINFGAGLLIEKWRDTKKATIAMAVAVIFDICVLLFFKYTGFFVENFNAISPVDLPVPKIVMPIGISFFTFQILSYVIDCYWGTIKVQRSFPKLLMYISMFPQLVAGPIVRYSVIEKEIDDRKITMSDISDGITRICVGLGKKVILANNLSVIVDSFFKNGNLGELSVLGTWYTVIVYAMQVYFDFSGYSDIAIGIGRIFGFHFDENFNYPFISKNITEFWQRWHISLGTFFRDYVLYLPIFGKRRKYLNLFLVWFCTGFWHGASWNYIIWGLYFGVFILIERMIGAKRLKKIPLVITHIYSKLVIIVGFGIFYFVDFGKLTTFLGNLIGLNGNSLTDKISLQSMTANLWLFIACIIFCLPVIPFIKKKMEEAKLAVLFGAGQTVFNVAAFVMSSILLVNATNNPFIYWQF